VATRAQFTTHRASIGTLIGLIVPIWVTSRKRKTHEHCQGRPNCIYIDGSIVYTLSVTDVSNVSTSSTGSISTLSIRCQQFILPTTMPIDVLVVGLVLSVPAVGDCMHA